MKPRAGRWWRFAAIAVALTVVAAACGDDDAPATTGPPETVTVTSIVEVEVPGETVTSIVTETTIVTETSIVEVVVEPGDPRLLTGAERCAANQEAGEINFLTGFLFFPAISIAVVLAAEEMGFFDDMCLDVNITASVPGESIVLISGNVIQFATNQLAELAQAQVQGAQATMVFNWGHTPVHVILVEEDSPIQTPADFAGATIGSVGGTLNAGLQGLLLNGGGLSQANGDYTVVNRSFNPFEIEAFDAIAAFRSNEPDTLNNNGVPVRQFRPEDFDSVGTFAGIMVSNTFAQLHPSATEDWVRAVAAATEWSIANPEEAVRIAEGLCKGVCFGFGDDPAAFAHELFRFSEEVKLSLDSTPPGHLFGAIHGPTAQAEADALIKFGILDALPNFDALYDNQYIAAVHDDSQALIWECIAETCVAPR